MKRFTSAMLALLLVMTVVCAGGPALADPPDAPATTTWEINDADPDAAGIYDTGSWEWDTDTNTLTLKNFHFTTSAATAMLLRTGVTIILEGNNSITSTYSELTPSSYGVDFRNALNIEGDGSLTVTAGNVPNGSSMGIVNNYTTDVLNIRGGTVTAIGQAANAGSSRGISCGGIAVTGTGRLIAKGNDGAVYCENEPYGIAKGSDNVDGPAEHELVWGADDYYHIEDTEDRALYVELLGPDYVPPSGVPAQERPKSDLPPPIVGILYDVTKTGDIFSFKVYIANARGSMPGAVTVRLNDKYSTAVTIGEDGIGFGTIEAPGYSWNTVNISTHPNLPGAAEVGTPYQIFSDGRIVRR